MVDAPNIMTHITAKVAQTSPIWQLQINSDNIIWNFRIHTTKNEWNEMNEHRNSSKIAFIKFFFFIFRNKFIKFFQTEKSAPKRLSDACSKANDDVLPCDIPVVDELLINY